MKHECVSVDKFSDNDASEIFQVKKQKDYAIENALTVFEGYFMCLLHYI